MFTSKMYLPESRLQKWIKAFWVVEGGGIGSIHRYHLIPDGCATLVLILNGTIELPFYRNGLMKYGAYVIPPNTQPHDNLISDNIFHIDIQLNPGVFHKLFGIPVSLLENRIYNLNELSIPFDNALLEQLIVNRGNIPISLVYLNNAIHKMFSKKDFYVDPLLMGVTQLYKDGDIDKFFLHQKLSIRQLQRNVKNMTGIGPKTISRISRFYSILEDMKNKQNNCVFSYYDVEADFSDQSHFIREFKSFAGLPPIQFMGHSEEFLQYTGLCQYHKSVL